MLIFYEQTDYNELPTATGKCSYATKTNIGELDSHYSAPRVPVVNAY